MLRCLKSRATTRKCPGQRRSSRSSPSLPPQRRPAVPPKKRQALPPPPPKSCPVGRRPADYPKNLRFIGRAALLRAFLQLSGDKARSPKAETRKKSEIRSPKRKTAREPVCPSDFGFRASFGSRISTFGFMLLQRLACWFRAALVESGATGHCHQTNRWNLVRGATATGDFKPPARTVEATALR